MYVISFPTPVALFIHIVFFFIDFAFFSSLQITISLLSTTVSDTNRWTETNGAKTEREKKNEAVKSKTHSFMRENDDEFHNDLIRILKLFLRILYFPTKYYIYLSYNKTRQEKKGDAWMRVCFVLGVCVFFSIVDWSGLLLLSTFENLPLFFSLFLFDPIA